jgi:hypothetical protein
MSNNRVGEEEGDFKLTRKDGKVEIWHNPKTGSYTIVLYEHINREEDQLLDKTVYNKEKADVIFDTVIDIIK